VLYYYRNSSMTSSATTVNVDNEEEDVAMN
jgi:hypothetical protein